MVAVCNGGVLKVVMDSNATEQWWWTSITIVPSCNMVFLVVHIDDSSLVSSLMNTNSYCMSTMLIFNLQSTIKPKTIKQALLDHKWVADMHEELEALCLNETWELVNLTNERGGFPMSLSNKKEN